jgi:hypothetical protein
MLQYFVFARRQRIETAAQFLQPDTLSALAGIAVERALNRLEQIRLRRVRISGIGGAEALVRSQPTRSLPEGSNALIYSHCYASIGFLVYPIARESNSRTLLADVDLTITKLNVARPASACLPVSRSVPV